MTSYKDVSMLPLIQTSLDEYLRAKGGGKEETGKTALRLYSFFFPWPIALRHQSLACSARFCVKSEATEEKAA